MILTLVNYPWFMNRVPVAVVELPEYHQYLQAHFQVPSTSYCFSSEEDALLVVFKEKCRYYFKIFSPAQRNIIPDAHLESLGSFAFVLNCIKENVYTQ